MNYIDPEWPPSVEPAQINVTAYCVGQALSFTLFIIGVALFGW